MGPEPRTLEDCPGLSYVPEHNHVDIDSTRLYIHVIGAPDTRAVHSYVLNYEPRFRQVDRFQEAAREIAESYLLGKLTEGNLRKLYAEIMSLGKRLLERGVLRRWEGKWEETTARSWARPAEFLPFFVCTKCWGGVLYASDHETWHCPECDTYFQQEWRGQWKDQDSNVYPVIRAAEKG